MRLWGFDTVKLLLSGLPAFKKQPSAYINQHVELGAYLGYVKRNTEQEGASDTLAVAMKRSQRRLDAGH